MRRILIIGCSLALTFIYTLLEDVPVYAESGDLISHNFNQVPALTADSRTLKISDKLRVNADRNQRIVVPNKCEDAGEMELKLLAATSGVEESYVFVPSLCLWIETGFAETDSNVRLDKRFVDELLKDHHSLVVYHIHVGKGRDFVEYLPAYSDMIGLILLNAEFFMNPEFNVIHRAMTSVGAIDYSFVLSEETQKLIGKLNESGLGDFIAQNLAYEFNRDYHKQRYYAAVRDCIRLPDRSPESLADCFPIRADDFVLEYRTVSDYAFTVSRE